MAVLAELIRDSHTVLLVDWPSRDVPDTLARAGYTVVSADGPADEYNAYEVVEGRIAVRPVADPPDRVDFVYSHRPVDELPRIVEQARSLGARAIWLQSGLDATGARDPRGSWLPEDQADRARRIVEEAGLAFVDGPYLADAVRAVSGTGYSDEGESA